MRKYLEIASLEWRNALAYRGDVILNAFFQIFRVLLAYLLWKTVIRNGVTVGGLTLPEMVTYYLLGAALTPLTRGEGLLWDFAGEIRSGQYVKYQVRPVSPLGYFMAAGVARALLPALMGGLILGAVMVLFPSYFAVLRPASVGGALLISVLAMILNLLIGYLISVAAFKFINISGFFILKTIIMEFLSGALVPLHLIFGDGLPVWSPFSYLIYYPVLLCLGKADISLGTAFMVLSVWIGFLYLACRFLQQRAAQAFEGVGM